jgi:hypothetical protein
MAGRKSPRDPAHLPTKLLVKLVGVWQIPIAEDDHDHADRQRHCEDRKKLPQPTLLLKLFCMALWGIFLGCAHDQSIPPQWILSRQSAANNQPQEAGDSGA